MIKVITVYHHHRSHDHLSHQLVSIFYLFLFLGKSSFVRSRLESSVRRGSTLGFQNRKGSLIGLDNDPSFIFDVDELKNKVVMRQNASLQLGTLYSEVYKEMQNNIKAKVINVDYNNDDDMMIIVMMMIIMIIMLMEVMMMMISIMFMAGMMMMMMITNMMLMLMVYHDVSSLFL